VPFSTSDVGPLIDGGIELMTEFLRFMIKFHAWSSARPRIELDKAEGELEGRVRVLRGVEEEQGGFCPRFLSSRLGVYFIRSRARLGL